MAESLKKKENSIKMNKIRTKIIIISGIALFIIAAITAILYMVDYYNTKPIRDILDTDTIYPNVLVNSVNIGGMKKEDALKVLQKDVQEPYENSKMTFIIDGDEEVSITFAQFGVKLNIEEAVERAYNYAREGNIDERYEKYDRLKLGDPYSFDVDCTDENGELPKETVDNIRKVLSDEFSSKVYVAPKNGDKGRELDIDLLADTVIEYITINQGENMAIHVPTKEI